MLGCLIMQMCDFPVDRNYRPRLMQQAMMKPPVDCVKAMDCARNGWTACRIPHIAHSLCLWVGQREVYLTISISTRCLAHLDLISGLHMTFKALERSCPHSPEQIPTAHAWAKDCCSWIGVNACCSWMDKHESQAKLHDPISVMCYVHLNLRPTRKSFLW